MTDFHRTWLIAWCWLALAISVMFLMAVIPALSAPARLFLDVVFWPLDGQPSLTAPDAVFSTSLVGAILIGWLVLMLGLIRDPVLSRNPKVWRLMTLALVVWYIIDSTASVLAGASVNALSNTLLVAGWIIPVVASGILGATAQATAMSSDAPDLSGLSGRP